MDYVLQRSQTPGDVLFGKVNAEACFISGHSRGGGAAQVSHSRSTNLRIRGSILFMPFDMIYFNAIPLPEDRLPSLIISAHNDGDLVFPFVDEIIERPSGPMTFVDRERRRPQLPRRHPPGGGERDDRARSGAADRRGLRRRVHQPLGERRPLPRGELYRSEDASSGRFTVAVVPRDDAVAHGRRLPRTRTRRRTSSEGRTTWPASGGRRRTSTRSRGSGNFGFKASILHFNGSGASSFKLGLGATPRDLSRTGP